MFCSKCGAQLVDGAAFCGACGAPQEAPVQPAAPEEPVYQAPAQPVYEAPAQEPYQQPAYTAAPVGEPHHGYVNFGQAIQLYWTNIVNFKGRASKSEFWWGYLFGWTASLVVGFIPYVGTFLGLAFMLPNVSLMVRRFHDLSIPWQNIFKFLIPVYGIIYMIQTFLLPSVGDNEFGPGPR